MKARLKGTRNPRETPCASRRKDVVLAAGQIQILTACLSLQLCQPMCKCRQHFTKTPIVPFQVHQVSHLETRSHNVMLTLQTTIDIPRAEMQALWGFYSKKHEINGFYLLIWIHNVQSTGVRRHVRFPKSRKMNHVSSSLSGQ